MSYSYTPRNEHENRDKKVTTYLFLICYLFSLFISLHSFSIEAEYVHFFSAFQAWLEKYSKFT